MLPILLAAYSVYGSTAPLGSVYEYQRCSSGALVASEKNGIPTLTSSRPVSQKTGLASLGGDQPGNKLIGRNASGSSATAN